MDTCGPATGRLARRVAPLSRTFEQLAQLRALVAQGARPPSLLQRLFVIAELDIDEADVELGETVLCDLGLGCLELSARVVEAVLFAQELGVEHPDDGVVGSEAQG